MAHEQDYLERGYQPLRQVHQPGTGHQPIRNSDTPRQIPQDRGRPPSGGSGVKPPDKKS